MKIYAVGGSVRDTLLGLTPQDKDYVVVGATPEQMIELGFEKVGASFPVFLKNGEEYALARTERKIGVGYNGFEVEYNPNVTLEEDLIRRDLTINSMAIDPDTGEIIDPFGGQRDLKNKVLRHTSEAFAEDPIRILRTARFAARYGFVVHPETIALMSRVVSELYSVPKERIWKEFEKGLMEENPIRMMTVLRECGALSCDVMEPYSVCDYALADVNSSVPLPVRFTLVGINFKSEEKFAEYRIPNDCARTCSTFNWNFDRFVCYVDMTKKQRLDFLLDLGLVRNSVLFEWCMMTLSFFVKRPLFNYAGYSIEKTIVTIKADVQAIKSVNAATIAATCSSGSEIKQKIYDERLKVIGGV